MDATANLWFLILDTVSLINNQISPVELFENGPLDDNHLIGSHAHIPLAWQQRVTDKSRLQPEVLLDGTVYDSLNSNKQYDHRKSIPAYSFIPVPDEADSS